MNLQPIDKPGNLPVTAMLLLLKALMLFFLPGLAFAQEYQEIESNNIRVDPEWARSYESRGFSFAYDVKTDEKGNSYATGYFTNYLGVGKQTIVPDCKSGDCNNIFFLMKHDSRGNLLWIRYASGNSRPCRIAFDSRGNVYVAGSVFSKALVFTSLDTTTEKLNKPFDYNTGIFIAKYNPDGKVLETRFYTGGLKETANDFFIDARDNLYIGGNYEFRNFDRRNEMRRSYLLLKFSKTGKLLWEQKGDTVGQSHINSAYTDKKGNVYVTGSFTGNIRFGTQKFKSAYNGNNLFAARFDAKGKVTWATDNIGEYRSGYGQAIACDANNQVYILGATTNSQFLAKLGKDGKPEWVQTAKGKGMTMYPGKMLIGPDNSIYFCGEGYGAVFGSSGPNLLSYKPKGGTDFYLARYSDKGKLLWMKAGGGEGTDYCKAIALHKNKVVAFGLYGGNITFNDSTLKSQTGYTFWLASFDQKKPEFTETSPQKKSTPVTGDGIGLNPAACTCSQEPGKLPQYAPMVKTLVSYHDFAAATGWQQAGNPNFYDHLFFYNFQNSHSSYSSYNSLNLLCFGPLKLLHPDKTFGLNLTPCAGEKNAADLPVTVSYSHSIRRYDPTFDHTTFDGSAGSYLEVLMMAAGVRAEALLYRVLLDYNVTNLKQFSASVNKKYKTSIKLAGEDPEAAVEEIAAELNRNDIPVKDFILQEFVWSAGGGKGKANAAEAERLQLIFSKWLGNFILSDIDTKIIRPQIQATVSTRYLGIDLSPSILRQWDAVKNKPATDKNGNFIPAAILLKADEVNFSSQAGLDAKIKETCFTRSEIAGTGILLSFHQSFITEAENPDRNTIDFYRYPLFITDSAEAKNSFRGMPGQRVVYRYDTLLTKFSGLFVPEARLNIPFKGKMISAKATGIIINNFVISGSIELPFAPVSAENPEQIKIASGESEMITDLQELKESFRQLGLKQVKIEKNHRAVTVYFRKS